MIKTVIAAGIVTCFAAGAALAQSGPQFEEIRSACLDDVKRLCSSVEPVEVPDCLKQHIDQVSDGCKATVKSVRQEDEAGHD
ncbi:hypothetical protein [Amorphus coralli]|uniref:hypothetical protein n=1 Tax=Amorphus coralli TaxID=340680 RepID=UPI00037ABB0F|nr:hypothetical protein [Amorphus coralli]